MSISLDSIQRGAQNFPPRYILLGVPKVGKSTFAAEWPSPVFLPIKGEEGIDALDTPRFPTLQNFDELMQALGSLAEGDTEFKTIVIDSISALEPVVWDHTARKNDWYTDGKPDVDKKGYGKGYVAALTYWRQLMDVLDYLRTEKGIASVLIGHVKTKKIDDPMLPQYDSWVWDIQERAASSLTKWADAVHFARFKNHVKAGDDGAKGKAIGGHVRELHTQARPGHPGGGRGQWGHIPETMPLSYEALRKEIAPF